MTSSSPPIEPRGRAARRAAGAALLVAGAGLLAGAAAQEVPEGEGDPSFAKLEFAFPLDLTEDFYHRLRAGLFVPEREPLVMRLLLPGDADDLNSVDTRPAPHRYMRFEWGQGTFDVRSDRNGVIAVHLDDVAAISHLIAIVPPTLAAMTREFPEHPLHPIQ